MSDRMPPFSREAEIAVLGSIMQDGYAMNLCADMLVGESFYCTDCQMIYEVALDLYERGKAVDTLTVTERLMYLKQIDDVGGAAFVSEVVDQTPTSAHIQSYATIVDNMYKLRCMIKATKTAMELCWKPDEDLTVTEIIDKAEQTVFDAIDHSSRSGFESLKTIGRSVIDDMTKMQESGREITGLDTGFRDLNEMLAGLQNGNMVVIAARPSMGKTALAMNMAEYISSQPGQCAAFFSMEMTKKDLFKRMLSGKSQVNGKMLRMPTRMRAMDWQSLTVGAATLKDYDLFIDDTPALTPTELRSRARRLKYERPDLAVIFVDYLQLMRAHGYRNNRDEEMGYISGCLKALAKDMDIPIVVLSQLNRESEKNSRGGVPERPRSSQLRESGSIEQDADVIMMLYRKHFYTKAPEDNEKALLIIGKQRNGATGDVLLRFIDKFAQFSDAKAEWTNEKYDY